MNKYLLMSKSKQIRKAIKDFETDFCELVTTFTKKNFFYFLIEDGVKYIHKNSLRFCITNADTYSYDISPTYCSINDKNNVELFNNNVNLTFDFLRKYKGDLLPDLMESEHFFYYNFLEGEPLTSITKEDFFKLKELHNEMNMTPFYNSMCYNIIREPNGEIKLIDFKHFEIKDEKPFFIYMNNDDHNVNTLYIEPDVDLDIVLEHLRRDYNVQTKHIIYINK